MKKKIMLGAAIGVAALIMAGCSGSGTGENEKTTVTSSETKTDDKTTAATTQTTDTQQKNDETTTAADTGKNDTKETGSSAESDPSENSLAEYTISVVKTPEGFEQTGDNSYKSAGAQYSYTVLSGVTKRTVEAELDDEALKLDDVDLGIIDDILYVKGKKDGGYSVTAYRYAGEGKSASTYSGIEYISNEEISAEKVAELLTDEYITLSE